MTKFRQNIKCTVIILLRISLTHLRDTRQDIQSSTHHNPCKRRMLLRTMLKRSHVVFLQFRAFLVVIISRTTNTAIAATADGLCSVCFDTTPTAMVGSWRWCWLGYRCKVGHESGCAKVIIIPSIDNY